VVNGTAQCWGESQGGQLGNGKVINNLLSPSLVQGLTTGVTAIACGEYYTCAIVNDGVQCWGANGGGQLGDGTTTERYSPVTVLGL
jgi:alpha-tubulin suppressor-like RCC1 family protein